MPIGTKDEEKIAKILELKNKMTLEEITNELGYGRNSTVMWVLDNFPGKAKLKKIFELHDSGEEISTISRGSETPQTLVRFVLHREAKYRPTNGKDILRDKRDKQWRILEFLHNNTKNEFPVHVIAVEANIPAGGELYRILDEMKEKKLIFQSSGRPKKFGIVQYDEKGKLLLNEKAKYRPTETHRSTSWAKDRQKRILDFLNKDRERLFLADVIASETDIPTGSIYKELDDMEKEGLIYLGPGKPKKYGTYYPDSDLDLGESEGEEEWDEEVEEISPKNRIPIEGFVVLDTSSFKDDRIEVIERNIESLKIIVIEFAERISSLLGKIKLSAVISEDELAMDTMLKLLKENTQITTREQIMDQMKKTKDMELAASRDK